HEGQDIHGPTALIVSAGLGGQIEYTPRREVAADTVIVVAGQGELLEVVLALGAGRRLAALLYRGGQPADEAGDGCGDHQQLHQREAATVERNQFRSTFQREAVPSRG